MAELKPESWSWQPARRTSPRRVVHDMEHELCLLEHLDGRLSEAEDQAMAAHLAGCSECAELAREWAGLDAKLTAQFKPEGLSPGFAKGVWSRIESAAGTAGAAAPGESLELDWSTAWARQRRRFLWTHLPAALDRVGYAFTAAFAAFFMWRILAKLLPGWLEIAQSNSQSLLLLLSAAGAFFLLMALFFSARRPVARLLASL